MKPIKGILTAAALVGAAALPTTANAAIITQTVNLNIPSTLAGLYLNLVTGAVGYSDVTPPTGWDVNLWSTTSLKFFFSGSNAPSGGVASTTTGPYLSLLPGAVIGASSTYSISASDPAAAAFHNTGTNIFGLRFFNEATGQTNYGYLTLATTGATGYPATLVSYTYENSGASITVGGATAGVPEPATWAMMMLGFGAMGFAMRRRPKVSARVRFA